MEMKELKVYEKDDRQIIFLNGEVLTTRSDSVLFFNMNDEEELDQLMHYMKLSMRMTEKEIVEVMHKVFIWKILEFNKN